MSHPLVTVIGKLGKPLELSRTGNGTALARFSIATSKSTKQPDGSWQQGEASWWRVTAWGQLAEQLQACNLSPGLELVVVGDLSEHAYTKKDGSEARSVELNAKTVAVSVTRGPVTIPASGPR